MKKLINSPQRFCFISNAEQSYLTEYIHLIQNDTSLDFSFKNINLTELKTFAPTIIIIDHYFTEKDYSAVINSLKLNFKNAKMYFLSPEYINYNRLIQSKNHSNHYYSNFSKDMLDHINSSIGRNDNQNNYLKAV